MTDKTILELTNRLNQLERSNQKFKRSLIGLGLVSVSLLSAGAAQLNQADPPKNMTCDTMHARKLVISDAGGHERLVLALDAGEPTLKMYNHEGRRQIFLGIDEFWEDTAYLSIASRLENGEVDKQAVLAATSRRPNSSSTTQLILYDGNAAKENAGARQVVRLSTGLGEQKPFLEINGSIDKQSEGVNLSVLESKPTLGDRQVLLDTNSSPASLSGVRFLGK